MCSQTVVRDVPKLAAYHHQVLSETIDHHLDGHEIPSWSYPFDIHIPVYHGLRPHSDGFCPCVFAFHSIPMFVDNRSPLMQGIDDSICGIHWDPITSCGSWLAGPTASVLWLKPPCWLMKMHEIFIFVARFPLFIYFASDSPLRVAVMDSKLQAPQPSPK